MTTLTHVPEPFAGDPRFPEWAARAVAHDLCNQLLAIQWSSSLLGESIEEPEAVRELGQEIEEAVGRARGAISFLSLLVSPAPAAGARSLDVRDLLDHASSLIRLVLGSDVGMELDLERCTGCRLGVEPRGFVRSLLRLAEGCAAVRPCAGLTLEAVTSFDTAAASPDGRLQVAILWQPRDGAGGPQEVIEASFGGLARYVELKLGGELVRRGAAGWELGVAVVSDTADERRAGEGSLRVVAPPAAPLVARSGRCSG